MTREEARAGWLRAADLVLLSKDQPQVMEMYRLYKRLQAGYMEALERALRAEDHLERIRAYVRREIGDVRRERDEPAAEGGNLWPGQGGGAKP